VTIAKAIFMVTLSLAGISFAKESPQGRGFKSLASLNLNLDRKSMGSNNRDHLNNFGVFYEDN
jgi:hypothetical protein